MKIQHLYQKLNEATKIEAKTADELWSSSSPKTYISNIEYAIKKNDDGTYQVTMEVNDRRKIINANVTSEFVSTNFTKLSKNAAPDVEGYTKYRSNGQREAVQHSGETAKVDIDGKKVTLNSGDYLIRSVENDEVVFTIETEDAFEADWVEK